MKKSINKCLQDEAHVCSTRIIHHDILHDVMDKMPGNLRIGELAYFFKIFGDSTRIGILWALSESEMCVCDICALLDMKQSAVSHQLKILKQSRIVKFRREGKVVYYSLDDDHIREVLNLGMQHINEILPPDLDSKKISDGNGDADHQ